VRNPTTLQSHRSERNDQNSTFDSFEEQKIKIETETEKNSNETKEAKRRKQKMDKRTAGGERAELRVGC